MPRDDYPRWLYITRARVGRDVPYFGTRELWTHRPVKTERGTFDHTLSRLRRRASIMRCTSKAGTVRRLGRDLRRGECVSLRKRKGADDA